MDRRDRSHLLLPAVALAALLAGPPAHAATFGAASREYANQQFGYRIRLPAGWTTAAGPLDRVVDVQTGSPAGVHLRLTAASRPVPSLALPPSSSGTTAQILHEVVLKRVIARDSDLALKVFAKARLQRMNGPSVAGAVTSHFVVLARAAAGEARIIRVAMCTRSRDDEIRVLRIQADGPLVDDLACSELFTALVGALRFDESPGAPAESAPVVQSSPAPASVSEAAAAPAHEDKAEAGPDAAPPKDPAFSLYSNMKPMSAADTKAMIDNSRADAGERTESERERARMLVTGGVMEVNDR